MAAKKTEAKPKAQPKAKADPKAEKAILLVAEQPANVAEVKFYESPEEIVKDFGGPHKPSLLFTASQLADMGRKFKAGMLSRQIVLDAHSAYLNAVKQGAEASEDDVKFVKGHLEVIKAW